MRDGDWRGGSEKVSGSARQFWRRLGQRGRTRGNWTDDSVQKSVWTGGGINMAFGLQDGGGKAIGPERG